MRWAKEVAVLLQAGQREEVRYPRASPVAGALAQRPRDECLRPYAQKTPVHPAQQECLLLVVSPDILRLCLLTPDPVPVWPPCEVRLQRLARLRVCRVGLKLEWYPHRLRNQARSSVAVKNPHRQSFH